MSSDVVTAFAALGGTVVGGAITLIGQAMDAKRRANTERDARRVSLLCDLAEGATAVRLQQSKLNLYITAQRSTQGPSRQQFHNIYDRRSMALLT